MICWLNTSHIYLLEIPLSYSVKWLTRMIASARTISKSVPPLTHRINYISPTSQNLQSTNWQTLRFKPPPPNSLIGWRVEFRSMEVQITDFENAAFSVFIVLLSRAILRLGLNFYIPISKVRDGFMSCCRY